MEVVHGIPSGSDLDLILHSPGGESEATEAVVDYLRSKFATIRVFVPQAAMSAATMMACAADEIVMGKHSSLGPIDPQFILPGPNGAVMVPAQAVLAQFEMAREECKDPANIGAWVPMLGQYGPALLVQCENALTMSERLAAQWLRTWMLARKFRQTKNGRARAASTARRIAIKLNDHAKYMSHGRHISRQSAKAVGLVIKELEADQTLQDLVLSVFHATTIVFDQTRVVKMIENHAGRLFGKQLPNWMGQQPAAQAPAAPPP